MKSGKSGEARAGRPIALLPDGSKLLPVLLGGNGPDPR